MYDSVVYNTHFLSMYHISPHLFSSFTCSIDQLAFIQCCTFKKPLVLWTHAHLFSNLECIVTCTFIFLHVLCVIMNNIHYFVQYLYMYGSITACISICYNVSYDNCMHEDYVNMRLVYVIKRQKYVAYANEVTC